MHTGRIVMMLCAVLTAGGVLRADTLIVDQQHPAAADANPGTRERPLRSISAAARAARAGDTVLVRPGIYRESVPLTQSGQPGKPIIFRSEEPLKAVLSGADVLTGWAPAGPGIWRATSEALARPGDRSIEGQWVHANGNPLQRTEDVRRLLPGMFFLDATNKTVYVAPEEGQTPETITLEFASRGGLFHARNLLQHKVTPPDHVHIIGFTLIHDASWVRGWGALRFSGKHWLIESNHVLWCTSAGMTGIQANGTIIRNNQVEWAGHIGITASESYRLRVEGNRFFHSNWRRVSPAWEAGGSKFSVTMDSVIRSNHFAYAFGPGVWFDGSNTGNLMEENLCHDNLGTGLFTEIDWGQIIRRNISFNNDAGVTVGESPEVLIQQNIFFNNDSGVRMRGDYNRRSGAKGERGPKRPSFEALDIDPLRIEQWKAQYIIYWNAPQALMLNNCCTWENLIFDNECNYFEFRNYAERSPLDPFLNNFSDFNIYWARNPQASFQHEFGNYGGLEAWRQASGRDAHSVVINPREEPAKLPAWAKAGEAYWSQRFRTPQDMKALDLQMTASPQAAETIARIRRSPVVRELRMSDPDLKAYVFELGGVPALALWSKQTFGQRYVRLNVGRDRVGVENGYLKKQERSLKNQTLDLAVTWMPVTLHGVGEAIREVESGLFRAQSFNLPGEAVPVEAVFLNETKTAAPLDVVFSAGSGFTAQPDRITRTLPPGQSVTVKSALIPDGTLRKGAGIARMEAAVGGDTLRRTVSFLVGEGSGKIPHLPDARWKTDGRLGDWKTVMARNPPLGVIATLEQLNDGDKASWSGAADLSARIYAAWSETALHVAVQVTDDTIVPAPPGIDPWGCDAVELFVDGRSPEMQWQVEPTEGCYQIGCSPAQGKVPLNTHVFTKGINRRLEGLQTASSLTRDGYVIEMSIPLSRLNFPAGGWQKGRAVKLAVILNDKDNPAAQNRDCAFYWAEKKGYFFMDTSTWPCLILDKE